MFKFVKNSTLFVVGLGTSLILGRWLKKREEEAKGTTSTIKAEPKAVDKPAEVVEIPLPPSAFAGLDTAESTESSSNGAIQPKVKAKPAEATVTTPDDFTQINGIGAKTAETLQAMGIATFADLAEADVAAIKEQVARVSLDKIEGWIAEAQKRSMA